MLVQKSRPNLSLSVFCKSPPPLEHRSSSTSHRITTPAETLDAYLRELQRRHHLSVRVAHHAKKGGARIRAGQALRGSSEFHAWGDSNLYLRRNGYELSLTVERRAAPSIPPIHLELAQRGDSLALQLRATAEPVCGLAASSSADDRILRAPSHADRPVPRLSAARPVWRPQGDAIDRHLESSGPLGLLLTRRNCKGTAGAVVHGNGNSKRSAANRGPKPDNTVIWTTQSYAISTSVAGYTSHQLGKGCHERAHICDTGFQHR